MTQKFSVHVSQGLRERTFEAVSATGERVLHSLCWRI